MKQYELSLPPPKEGTVKRLLKTVSGRQLKMAGDTTNATMLLAGNDILHLFDIDANGEQHHAAQLAMSPKQSVHPKLVPVNYKPPRSPSQPETPSESTGESSSDKSESTPSDSPAATPETPPEAAPPARKPTAAELAAQLKAKYQQAQR